MESARVAHQPAPCQNPQILISGCNDTELNDMVRCLYTNADTLTNKLDELKAVIEIECQSIVVVTEVVPKNAKDPVVGPELQIPHFKQ